MTVQEIIDELTDHGFEDTSTTRKEGVINDTIADLCSRESWPFLEKTISLTFDGTNATPSNFPTDFSKALVLTDPTNDNVIQWERADVIRRRYRGTLTQAGTPEYYYFIAGSLKLYPVPGASQTLDLEYVCWHPTVTSASVAADILIPSRHHRAITVGALYKLYAMEDDPEQAQYFETEYEHRISMMRSDLIDIQYDTPDRIFVMDDDDDFYYLP